MFGGGLPRSCGDAAVEACRRVRFPPRTCVHISRDEVCPAEDRDTCDVVVGRADESFRHCPIQLIRFRIYGLEPLLNRARREPARLFKCLCSQRAARGRVRLDPLE